MAQWWESLSLLQRIFGIVAIPSTIALIVQTILVLIGIGDSHLEADTGTDMHIDGHADNLGDTAGGLTLISVRGILAFFAIGGWSGIALGNTGWQPIVIIIISAAAGTAAMFVIALLFFWTSKLQSSGNIQLKNAIGKNATVYLTVPGGGSKQGKVTLIFQGRFMECDAVTRSDRDLKTGEQVHVVGLAGEGTLLVSPVMEDTVTNRYEVN